MEKHYLKEQGYGLVTVKVSPELWQRVNEYSELARGTKTDYFNLLILEFLNNELHPRPTFLATMNGRELPNFNMWIIPEAFEKLKEVSREHHISIRSICFTALVSYFGKLDASFQERRRA